VRGSNDIQVMKSKDEQGISKSSLAREQGVSESSVQSRPVVVGIHRRPSDRVLVSLLYLRISKNSKPMRFASSDEF
jgi:hypothetical protein